MKMICYYCGVVLTNENDTNTRTVYQEISCNDVNELEGLREKNIDRDYYHFREMYNDYTPIDTFYQKHIINLCSDCCK